MSYGSNGSVCDPQDGTDHTSSNLARSNSLNGVNLETELLLEDIDLETSVRREVENMDMGYGHMGSSTFPVTPFSVHLDGMTDTTQQLLPALLQSAPSTRTQAPQARFDHTLIETMKQDCVSADVANAITEMYGHQDAHLTWPATALSVDQCYDHIQADQSAIARRRSYLQQNHDNFGMPASEVCLSKPQAEDDLLMDYLDRVFYIYCPFYWSKHQQSRGWLLSVLRRDRAAYYAALALSELHQLNRAQHSSKQVTTERGSHYSSAVQELQLRLTQLAPRNGITNSTENVGLLVSILHLLFYEMSLGGRHNWQRHLSAAAVLLEPLAHNLPNTSFAAIRYNAKHVQRKAVMRSEEEIAIGFLLSFFVRIDIIGCASTRSTPVLTLDHQLVLELCGTSPMDPTGCHATVMGCILDITSLDSWKEEMTNAHALSLVELTNRGRRIEKCLRERLAIVETGLSKKVKDSAEITKIFALAATIYLHVVISGAYPEIPEIAESVSRTIDALHDLSDPKLLRNVAWPFCVSGCLATSSQQHLFRKLLSPSWINQPQFGTILEAFGIMKDCWQRRTTGSGSYDWAFTMKKQQEYVLLG